MGRLPILLVLVSIASTASARELRYTVDLRHPETHQVSIVLTPVGYRGAKMTFQMPAWAPGAYSVSHYGNYVQDFQAVDIKGKPLTVTRENEDRWTISSASRLKEIRYNVLDSHDDSTSLYFGMANFDTSLVYATATALYGYVNDDKTSPATIRYLKPTSWQLATALPPTSKGYSKDTSTTFQTTSFYARNYDVLADAPLMVAPEFQARSFLVGSTIYDIALVSQSAFAMDSLAEYTRKIVAAETDFFHDTPFDRYTFLIYSPTFAHMPTFAQGALEHANSSNYLMVNLSWPLFKQSFLSVLSHEFFHAWDVKRIHSSKLGPFDYAHRVETTSLWMAEGVTDYYAHTLLSRYGITRPANFFQDIQSWSQTLKHVPATSVEKSLEQLSIDESDFHIESAMLFYIKGPLVAWMLDLEIRHQTENKKSLDDVMLALNADAQKGKSFRDEDLIGLVQKYSGADLKDFYSRYIAGTDTLPLNHYLSYMGVRMAAKRPSGSLTMGSDSSLTFESIDAGSPYASAGIQAGDKLLALDHTPITLDNIESFIRARDERRHVILTIEHDGKGQDLNVDFGALGATQRLGPVEIDPKSTALEAKIRKGVLGSES
jgi:predicted metalloprotease with PDZ domain